jgi:hypothetical protein
MDHRHPDPEVVLGHWEVGFGYRVENRCDEGDSTTDANRSHCGTEGRSQHNAR